MNKSGLSLRSFLYGSAALGLLAVALPAKAADSDAGDNADENSDSDTIVVSATRSGEGINRDLIGSSVTVIDSQEMADRETRIVSDVLRDVPGVAVNRTGAVGGLTQVRIRGSEGNHVLVFVDGIKVDDPYQGEFDWATLIADDAARIEVLRGQQSSLYGSDAIGGVISYTTLSGREAPGVSARAEAGSFNTYDGSTRIAGTAGDTLDYALSGAFYDTGGYPTAPGGTRDVSSENIGTSAKVNWTPSADFHVTGVLRYSYTKADGNDQGISANSPILNGRPIVTTIDTAGEYYTNDAWYGLLQAQLNSFDGHLTSSLMGQFATTARDGYASYGYSYGDKGTRYRGSFVNTLHFGDDHVKQELTAALDLEREEFHAVDPSGYADTGTHVLNTVGLVGQYRLTVDDRFAATGSLRHDFNDYFDDDTTWHVDASYLFPEGTRIHAAGGSGVKDPGAFELFGYSSGLYIGNPNLKPEESLGWEAGVDQSFLNGAVTVGATYFHSRFKDEIYTAYPPPDYIATSYNRTTTTHQQGIELFGEARLGKEVEIDASYTWLDAPQLQNVLVDPQDPNSFGTAAVEAQAVRRPKDIASFNLTYSPTAIPFSATLTVRYNGKMNDLAFDENYSEMYAVLKAYTLVNLALRYDVTKNIEVFARAENLFNEDYQEVLTFETPGRAIYGGVRVRL